MSTTDDDYSADDLAALTDEMEIEEKARELRVMDKARALNAARNAPPLRWMTNAEFDNRPRPAWRVPNLLHADSLSVMFGPTMSGKSFVALDVALCMATGRPWRGQAVERAPVVFVMGEGESVMVERKAAWQAQHDVRPDELDGWWFAATEGVQLTEPGVARLAEMIANVEAKLVVLDTKHTLMVGSEVDGGDVAEMIRAMHVLRRASPGASVMLIDHVALADGSRPRGHGGLLADMDDAALCARTKSGQVYVEVVKNKAGPVGASWSWDLVEQAPAAVLAPATGPTAEEVRDDDDEPLGPVWRRSLRHLPPEIEHAEGNGKAALRDLALLMSWDAAPAHGDKGWVGLTRPEAKRELAKHGGHSEPSVRRAWSALVDMELIKPAPNAKGSARSVPHVWMGPDVSRPGADVDLVSDSSGPGGDASADESSDER